VQELHCACSDAFGTIPWKADGGSLSLGIKFITGDCELLCVENHFYQNLTRPNLVFDKLGL